MPPSSFLLEEYKHLTDSFLRNEEMGERRVNLFLTLTTTIIGALAAVREIFGKEDVKIFIVGLLAVLLLGAVTFVRIIKRNLDTDEYLRGLARIRRYFADKEPEILPYLSYKPYDDSPMRRKEWSELFSPGTGGMLETVALVNSVIVAGLTGLLAYLYIGWFALAVALVVLICAWVIQFAYSKTRYDRKKEKIEIHFPAPLETEVALIIISEKPEGTEKKIADRKSLEKYDLQDQGTKTIHDIYFDTSEKSLQSRKVALRLRYIDGSHLITLKGQSSPLEGGGVERLEIEKKWSMNALSAVLDGLKLTGIRMPSPEDFKNISPVEVMKNMGLNVVQDRETQREIRNIVQKKKTGHVLAELGIDHVIFKFREKKINLHEIEIEAKSQDGIQAIKEISESLFDEFKPELRRWDHGKLATGKAIEELHEDGALEGFLYDDNNLKPDAYEKIDDFLRGFKYVTI